MTQKTDSCNKATEIEAQIGKLFPLPPVVPPHSVLGSNDDILNYELVEQSCKDEIAAHIPY